MMETAIYSGRIYHTRFIPKLHQFNYPFFMWFLDLDRLEDLPDFGRWFSVSRWALSRFRRADYLGDPGNSLAESVKEQMMKLTGREVEGQVYGLMNLRTIGLYFSPVNFYYGFSNRQELTHLLAEVSNIPWNERHVYAHYLPETEGYPINEKSFKVSPFNPENNQLYRWKVGSPGRKLEIGLGVYDNRGHVFDSSLILYRQPFTRRQVRNRLLRTPVMTAVIVSRIYWQAMKLFLKGIPFIPYKRETS